MSKQSEIILACTHDNKPCETSVKGSDGKAVSCCTECWNAGHAAYKKESASFKQDMKAKGVSYWGTRGIKVGDRVSRLVASGLFGGRMIEGVAKVGRNGAYVSSSYQKGLLAPEGWEKV